MSVFATCMRGIAASLLSEQLSKNTVKCTFASCQRPSAKSYGSAHYCEEHVKNAPPQHLQVLIATDPSGRSKAMAALLDDILILKNAEP